jgi:hypothetical protein
MLFRERVAVQSDNHLKYINTFCGQNVGLQNVKAGGTCKKLPLHFEALKVLSTE